MTDRTRIAVRNHSRCWSDDAVRLIQADARRSADTHLIRYPLPSAWSAVRACATNDSSRSSTGTSEITAVRAFLQRREQLRPAARRTLAAQLAARVRPRVAGVRPGLDDESFLERLAAAKAGTESPESGH